MSQHHELCFVIADGGHARSVRPAADNALHTFEAFDSLNVHKHTRDLVSDRAGHTGEPRHDPHELEKIRFAHLVAERVNEESAAGVFNELVVVAPPHVLSELMGALDQPTSARLLGNLPKDLVKVSDHELWPHLKHWVRPVHRAGSAPA